MSSDTDKDRPIPAEIIKEFSTLETAGDCSDLVLSGYADAMIELGCYSKEEIKVIRSMQSWEFNEYERQASVHYEKYCVLGSDYNIPDRYLHPEFKNAIQSIDTHITIKNLSLIVYPIDAKFPSNVYRRRLQKSLIALVKSKKLRINNDDQEVRFLLGEIEEDELMHIEISMHQLPSLKNSSKINEEYKKYYELWKGFYQKAQLQVTQSKTQKIDTPDGIDAPWLFKKPETKLRRPGEAVEAAYRLYRAANGENHHSPHELFELMTPENFPEIIAAREDAATLTAVVITFVDHKSGKWTYKKFLDTLRGIQIKPNKTE